MVHACTGVAALLSHYDFFFFASNYLFIHFLCHFVLFIVSIYVSFFFFSLWCGRRRTYILNTVCIFSELAVHDSFRITEDPVDGRAGDGSEPRLCFDLLIVNTGIPHAYALQYTWTVRKQLFRIGVKALSSIGGFRDGGYVRSFRRCRKREKKKKKGNWSWETWRDRSTWKGR
ncbi:hypothetical protein ACQKWADRAFT_23100 [Trichoderma austrokoningii]